MRQRINFTGDSAQVWADKTLGERPLIHDSAVVRDSLLGCWTQIGPQSRIVESEIGDYSYDAGDVSIIYTTVGKFCSIASHVRINPGNHPSDRITQHHMTYRRVQFGFDDREDEAFFEWRREHRCTVGHDTWIGHAATVMAGVSIGTGAIVGAGAVVTRDVEPYQVVAGVPARPIRYRFPDDVRERILESRWWDWNRPTLKERFDDLSNIPRFLERYCP